MDDLKKKIIQENNLMSNQTKCPIVSGVLVQTDMTVFPNPLIAVMRCHGEVHVSDKR